jgi:hypothetical protein
MDNFMGNPYENNEQGQDISTG